MIVVVSISGVSNTGRPWAVLAKGMVGDERTSGLVLIFLFYSHTLFIGKDGPDQGPRLDDASYISRLRYWSDLRNRAA